MIQLRSVGLLWSCCCGADLMPLHGPFPPPLLTLKSLVDKCIACCSSYKRHLACERNNRIFPSESLLEELCN